MWRDHRRLVEQAEPVTAPRTVAYRTIGLQRRWALGRVPGMSTPHARRYLALAALSVAGLAAGCATPGVAPLGAPAPTSPPSSTPPASAATAPPPTTSTTTPAGPTP